MKKLSGLKKLTDRPFELLLEMERRARAAVSGSPQRSAEDKEYVGIGFRLGDEQFLVARDEIREVLTLPSGVARVPGAKNWLRGLVNIRGQLLPLIDINHFFGGGIAANSRRARVLSVNHRDVPAGLLVDEVLGFRRFPESQRNRETPKTVIRCDRFLRGSFEQGGELWPVLSLKSLVESDEFLNAADIGPVTS
ncbi:MAG: chemotaxis protein CheW [Gammaproteobacteria bacterium]|nr:chemotaxis protein CheW [Gammaproteobacteria bacterium]MCZ6762048.1 chemotaxis protein CheW [Gammaproteobacteria bacterium]